MSQLKVNSIVPVGGLPAGASGGGIIQVVQAVKTNTASTTSTSFVDTGLTASITPTLNSSKILVTVNMPVGCETAGNRFLTNLVRGSTDIFRGDASGSRQRCSWQTTRGNEVDQQWLCSICFLDSPATTSSTTYKMQWKSESDEIYLNMNARNHDNNTHGMTASSITLFEVTV